MSILRSLTGKFIFISPLIGRDVYDVIKGIKPDIRSLFMSSYSFDILKDEITKESQLISKPVSPFELLKKIRDVLDNR